MMIIRPMLPSDYPEVYALWQVTSADALSEADSRPNFDRYLARNPSISQVCLNDQGQIVGTVLGGHDGRRGYIHHMAVSPEARRQGIARLLAQETLKRLKQAGITKAHIFVFVTNAAGKAAWAAMGWQSREDLMMFSKTID